MAQSRRRIREVPPSYFGGFSFRQGDKNFRSTTTMLNPRDHRHREARIKIHLSKNGKNKGNECVCVRAGHTREIKTSPQKI